ncbi:MAG: hypothetical protein SGPRY_004467, partial [Prymnesium sp.]
MAVTPANAGVMLSQEEEARLVWKLQELPTEHKNLIRRLLDQADELDNLTKRVYFYTGQHAESGGTTQAPERTALKIYAVDNDNQLIALVEQFDPKLLINCVALCVGAAGLDGQTLDDKYVRRTCENVQIKGSLASMKVSSITFFSRHEYKLLDMYSIQFCRQLHNTAQLNVVGNETAAGDTTGAESQFEGVVFR